MSERESVLGVVLAAVETYNLQVPEGERIDSARGMPLFGKKGRLDSLGLVNFIVAVEEECEEAFDLSLSLADERAFAKNHNPFRTIDALVDYVTTVIREARDA